jgi:exodeoxyribonuclease III
MRILSLNVNGLRSAASKGLFDWLPGQNADVICLQEVRMQADQRQALANLGQFALPGYVSQFCDATAKGYSGVAIYSKAAPSAWQHGIGVAEFDAEGRWVEAQFGALSVVSLYLPSGSSGPERQAFKFKALDWLSVHLKGLAGSGRRYIICGDWNIAHREIDLKNWRGNKKNSGFLPEERAWLDQLFANAWIDTHRSLKPDAAEYTWWSNRGQAYANDVGWRIDYQIASPNLQGAPKSVVVHRSPRFSDHAPLVVDFQLPVFAHE